MKTHPSPIRVLFILSFSIFVVEGIVMVILYALFPWHASLEILFDPLLLVVLLSPILYLFLLKPLLRLANELKGSESDLRDEKEKMTRLLDEMRSIEKVLKKSEQKYRLLHDNAFDAIIISNSEDIVLDCNPSAENVFGYPRGEIIGLPLTRLMPDRYRDSHEKGLKRFIQTGRPTIQNKVVEYEGLKKDGSTFPIELVITSLAIEGTVNFIGTIRDITERKKAQAEKELIQARLNQSQKMEALGRLSSGIAHDFNNILTNIQGNTELALEDMEEGSAAYQRLESIMLSVRHASKLTHHLMLLSKGQPLELRRQNLNSTIQTVLAMLKNLVGPEVSVATGLAPDLRECMADEANMEQVFMNLAVNARDAMPEGGAFSIKTRNTEVKDFDFPDIPEAYPCEAVCVEVSDTGTGMDQDSLEHIFEPFFSTKDDGEARGFGLAVVYGIIKRHKGWIKVESSIGAGTCFKIYLPIVIDQPPTPA